jgi:hypothetical protein
MLSLGTAREEASVRHEQRRLLGLVELAVGKTTPGLRQTAYDAGRGRQPAEGSGSGRVTGTRRRAEDPSTRRWGRRLSSQAGSFQFASPRISISAGTRTERTISARYVREGDLPRWGYLRRSSAPIGRRDLRHVWQACDRGEHRLHPSTRGSIGHAAAGDGDHDLLGVARRLRRAALEQVDGIEALGAGQPEAVAVRASGCRADRGQQDQGCEPRQDHRAPVSEAPPGQRSHVVYFSSDKGLPHASHNRRLA